MELDSTNHFETTEEFSPVWFDIDRILTTKCPRDDIIWYPRVLLNDEILTGTFRFRGPKLLDYDIEAVEQI